MEVGFGSVVYTAATTAVVYIAVATVVSCCVVLFRDRVKYEI